MEIIKTKFVDINLIIFPYFYNYSEYFLIQLSILLLRYTEKKEVQSGYDC
jgi:hypothetical protein